MNEIDFIQPKKTVGKLISADVLDKIRAEIDAHREELKTMADDDWYAGKLRGHDCDIEIIDKYRENEQEPKTGHWIKYGIPRCDEQHYKCTACGYYINFGQWGELYTKEFKYCPNCGCAMFEP